MNRLNYIKFDSKDRAVDNKNHPDWTTSQNISPVLISGNKTAMKILKLEDNNKQVNWTREAVRELIKIYKRNTHLYDTKADDYSNRDKRRVAMEEMAEAVSKYLPNVTADDCKKKCHGLRCQFRREYSKIRQPSCFDDLDDQHTSSFWCYKELLFLKDAVKERSDNFKQRMSRVNSSSEKLSSSLPHEKTYYLEVDSDSSSQNEIAFETVYTTGMPLNPPTKIKMPIIENVIGNASHIETPSIEIPIENNHIKSQNSTPTNEVESTSFEDNFRSENPENNSEKPSDSDSKDRYTIFGDFIASRLRAIGKDSLPVEHDIISLICKKEMELANKKIRFN